MFCLAIDRHTKLVTIAGEHSGIFRHQKARHFTQELKKSKTGLKEKGIIVVFVK